MSAKLIDFTALALLSGGVLFSSCGGNSSAFITNLRNFSDDKEITEVEYASLKGFLQRTPKGFDVGGTHISTEADLVSYLHGQGITSSAKALAVMPDVTFDFLQVYLENSASMKGYSNAGNPNFTAPVIALFNVGDPDTQIVTGYVGGSSSGEAALSPVERPEFESNLANGRVATAVSSPIDRIISLAIDSTSLSSVSCIVTDGILSGSNSEIQKDREFTIKNLPLLEQRIRDAVKKAHAKGLSMMIYRLETEFTGTYFDYRNTHHKLSGEERPYYMIFFGHQSNLSKVKSRLAAERSFDPENVLVSYEMGAFSPMTKALLLKMPGTADVTVIPARSTVQIKGNPVVPVDFKVRLAMQNLPSYYDDEDILERFLRFCYMDESYATEVDRTDFIQDIDEADEALKTYDVTFQIGNDFISSFSGSRKCRLVLPGFADPWYLEYSTEDDTDMDDEGLEDTFALRYLIGGILKGLEVRLPENAIDIEITLLKQ